MNENELWKKRVAEIESSPEKKKRYLDALSKIHEGQCPFCGSPLENQAGHLYCTKEFRCVFGDCYVRSKGGTEYNCALLEKLV